MCHRHNAISACTKFVGEFSMLRNLCSSVVNSERTPNRAAPSARRCSLTTLTIQPVPVQPVAVSNPCEVDSILPSAYSLAAITVVMKQGRSIRCYRSKCIFEVGNCLNQLFAGVIRSLESIGKLLRDIVAVLCL